MQIAFNRLALVLFALALGTPARADLPSTTSIDNFDDSAELEDVESYGSSKKRPVPKTSAYKRAFCSRSKTSVAKAVLEPHLKEQAQEALLQRKRSEEYKKLLEAEKRRHAAKGSCDPMEIVLVGQEVAAIEKAIGAIDGQRSENEGAFPNPYLMGFKNPKGAFNTGMCWFHSRFHRSMLYLAHFRPEQQRANKDMAKSIIRQLIRGEEVVEIPGFKSITEFTKAYEGEITSAFNDWAVTTAPRLLTRLGDRVDPETPSEFRSRMLHIYERVNHKKDIQFLRFSLDHYNEENTLTFASHSFLVVDMKPIQAAASTERGLLDATVVEGYKIQVLDSNYPNEIREVTCMIKDGRCDKYDAIPYIDFDEDLPDLNEAVVDYCAAG